MVQPEARFLVDAYYKIQEDRIRSASTRSATLITSHRRQSPGAARHNRLAVHPVKQTLENQIKAALEQSTALASPAGVVWDAEHRRSIGPVITSQTSSLYIDIAKSLPTRWAHLAVLAASTRQ